MYLIDERKQRVLSVIVDRYIRTGEPIGSKEVIKHLGVNVSSATIRNDMMSLENMGLLEKPHTSAGRIPSVLGYRYYIDHLMVVQKLTKEQMKDVDRLLDKERYIPDLIVENAVDVLSSITDLAVINTNALPTVSVITKVEVIPAGARLYAILIVTSLGNVKNKVCRLEFDITPEQMEFFQTFLNNNLQGINISQLSDEALQKLFISLGGYMMILSPLLTALCEMTTDLAHSDVKVTGQQRLLKMSDIESEQVANLITKKDRLSAVLSSVFSGVNVLFSQENDDVVISNSSLIVSPYNINDRYAGSFGVIGPLRINYSEVIPYIDYISSSVTMMLSDDNKKSQAKGT